MNRVTTTCYAAMMVLCIISCKKVAMEAADESTIDKEFPMAPPGGNYWTSSASFLAPKSSAASFVINGKAYVFGGFIGGSYKKDLWEYDPVANSWSQKASLPAPAVGRQESAAFVLNNKGYIVGGMIGPAAINQVSETWEYNPATNTWAQRANLPAIRTAAAGFAINGKGYITMGWSGTDGVPLDDVLEYDPVANTWTSKSNLIVPGQTMSRKNPYAFVVNNKAYIGSGSHITQALIKYFNDLWEYDPAANSWTQKANFPTGERILALGFSSSNVGYVGTGMQYVNGEPVWQKDFWQYRPSSNTWVQLPNFPGSARYRGVGFFVNNKAYIGLGYSPDNYFTNDFYKYTPATSIFLPVVN